MEPGGYTGEDALRDEYEDEMPILGGYRSRRLIEGINLKDLCDGKEILFELDKNAIETGCDTEDEIVHYDPKSLREKRGAPPLSCDFETLSSQMANVTEDGLVKKQVVTNGTGHIVPAYAFVTVHYNLYKKNCELPFDSTYLRGRPERFRLDQGETLEGLEMAIKTMKKNENSCFFINWQVAFGALGCPDRIEPKCDVIADITLMSFEEIKIQQDMNGQTQGELNKIDFIRSLNEAKKLLCRARDEFNKGNTKAASYIYRKSLRIVNSLRLANEEEERLMLKEKVRCLMNLAICCNKLGRSEQACVLCQEVLSIDQNNAKAYFHYGKATLALSNFKTAQRLLTRAADLRPNDRDINLELKRLNDKKALYEVEDKMFWKRAFQGKEEKKNTIREESSLDTFQQNLRQSLEDCLTEGKPYILSQPLLEDERKVCSRVASDLNLDFQTENNLNVFKRKGPGLSPGGST